MSDVPSFPGYTHDLAVRPQSEASRTVEDSIRGQLPAPAPSDENWDDWPDCPKCGKAGEPSLRYCCGKGTPTVDCGHRNEHEEHLVATCVRCRYRYDHDCRDAQD